MVQQRGEPQLPILLRCLPYPRQRTGRVNPAQSPGRVWLARVPLGQAPSLHPLRSRCSGVVRRLPRYYGSVRLPAFVRHRLPSSDFPMRPGQVEPSLGRTRDLPASVRDVSLRARVVDRARLRDCSRCRCPGCGLPHRVNASASWSLGYFAADSPWPVVSPVNASSMALRPCPHDSEPAWLAVPSPYDSFIRDILPDDACASAWRFDTSPPLGALCGADQRYRAPSLLSGV